MTLIDEIASFGIRHIVDCCLQVRKIDTIRSLNSCPKEPLYLTFAKAINLENSLRDRNNVFAVYVAKFISVYEFFLSFTEPFYYFFKSRKRNFAVLHQCFDVGSLI